MLFGGKPYTLDRVVRLGIAAALFWGSTETGSLTQKPLKRQKFSVFCNDKENIVSMSVPLRLLFPQEYEIHSA